MMKIKKKTGSQKAPVKKNRTNKKKQEPAPPPPVAKRLIVQIAGVAREVVLTDILYFEKPKTKEEKQATVFKNEPYYQFVQGNRVLGECRASSFDGFYFAPTPNLTPTTVA